MNELVLRTGPYRTTHVGTEIVRESTPEEWVVYGEILRRLEEAKQWAIGDWLVDGKRHYGDGVYKEAAGVLGLDKRTLENLKQISDRFEITYRYVNLSHTHHIQVASIKLTEEDKNGKLRVSKKEPDMDKIRELLEKAEKEEWSVKTLREAVSKHKRRQQDEIRLANEPEKFAVILADPAWEYDFSLSDSRQIDNQYTPSSLEDMKRLKVPAADDCVLFMWATSPKVEEAIELLNAWGFEYKTSMVWVKDKNGMGYYARQRHEWLLIATKGSLQLPDESVRPDSVIKAPLDENSEKPARIYEIVETMYPEYRQLKMFARTQREGWEAWGDESV